MRPIATRSILQAEETDCGAACLSIVLDWYGRHVPRHEVRAACGAGRDGLPIKALVRAAGEYGLRAEAKRVTLTPEHPTPTALPAPAVLLMERGHYVVFEGVSRKGRVHLNDPALGRRTLDPVEFVASFTGVAVVLTPAPEFRREGTPHRLAAECRRWLRPCAGLVTLATAAGLASVACSIGGALAVRAAVQAMTPESGMPGLAVPAAGLAAVALGMTLAVWLQQRILNRIMLVLALDRSRRLVRHMLRLPGSFFHSRFVAGVAARTQLPDTIATQLTTSLIPAATTAVALVAVLATITLLAPAQAAIALAGAVAGAAVIRRAAGRAKGLQGQLMTARFAIESEMLAGLSRIETVKAEGSAGTLYRSWVRAQSRGVELSDRMATVQQRHVSAATALDALTGLAVLVLGALQVEAGRLAAADHLAVLTLLGVFQSGAAALARSGLDLGRLRSGLAMLEDVEGGVPDRRHDEPARFDPDLAPLSGRVELRDVTFGYDTNRPPLIENLSLEIAPGRRVVIAGASGSGKTTLARLLIRAARPWTGQILLDGRPIDEVPRALWVRSVGYVGQHPVLFEGTVADNLALGDPGITEEHIRRALRDAGLERVVDLRGGPYRARVHQDGRNFSGGERQRLALARALCREPSLLVLDEATSALDDELEQQIDERLRRRGVTSIVIAHRLGTVRPGDLVVVMEGGKIVQQGTHAALVRNAGPYAELIGARS